MDATRCSRVNHTFVSGMAVREFDELSSGRVGSMSAKGLPLEKLPKHVFHAMSYIKFFLENNELF